VSNAYVMCSYCHACQSWQLFWSLSTQHADEATVFLDQGHTDMGPFDGPEAVLALARARLASLMLGSGLPWDSQPHF
jgi:hypothetical protein